MIPIQDFRTSIMNVLGYAPDQITPDGSIHRFETSDKARDQAGYCALFDHGDGFFAGFFGCFRTGVQQTWHSKNGGELTQADRERIDQAKAQAEAERERVHREAAEKALSIWEDSDPAPGEHPYLARKQISPNGARVDRHGNLLIPVMDMQGAIHSLQFIDAEGTKKFLKNGKVGGLFSSLKGSDATKPVIVAEGYATAATIHEALSGKYSVLVAYNAGNMEAVARAVRERDPGRQIIIAADNDHKTEGNPGITTGKKAATAVGGKVVWPEFPEGESGTDFNDLAQALGLKAVRSRIEQAHVHHEGIPEGFFLRPKGVYRRVEDKEGNAENVWTCSPLIVTALTRDEENQEWGRLLQVKDSDEKWHEWAMPMEMLAGSGEEYRKILFSLGLRLAPGKPARDALHLYLNLCKPGSRARCVKRTGWHGELFVLPDAVFGHSSGAERPVLQGQVAGNQYKCSGSLQSWQTSVGKYCISNPRLIFSASVALAGALLELAGAENSGFHFYGPSSIGKTTVLKVASSILGGGGVRGFVHSWRATDNGLESIAAKHCDTTLFLDELGQSDPRVAGATAYMLANGVGKHRARRDGSQRDPQEWRLLFLSTGEITLSDKIREDGRKKKAMAGQQIRVLDIPADAGAGMGIFNDLHGLPNGDRFSRLLKDNAAAHYGIPFREFLKRIVADRKDLTEQIRETTEMLVDRLTSPDSAPQTKRAAGKFGLVAAAGELAIQYDIFPWTEGAALEASQECFEEWMRSRGGDQDAEEQAAVEQLMHFLDEYGGSRFQDLNNEGAPMPLHRAGFVNKGETCTEFLILPAGFQEIQNGLSRDTMIRALLKHRLLQPDTDGKPQVKRTLPGLGRKRVYSILMEVHHDA